MEQQEFPERSGEPIDVHMVVCGGKGSRLLGKMVKRRSIERPHTFFPSVVGRDHVAYVCLTRL